MQIPGKLLLNAVLDDVEVLRDVARQWEVDFKPFAAPPGTGLVARVFQVQYDRVDFSSAEFRVSLDQTGMPPPHVT